MYLIFPFQKLESLAYIFVADSMGLSSYKFVQWAPKDAYLFCTRVRFGRSRSPKVGDFGTNRKRVCDFIFIPHYDYGAILHRFWDTATHWLEIARFSYPSLTRHPPPPLCFVWNFGVKTQVNHVETKVMALMRLSSAEDRMTDGQIYTQTYRQTESTIANTALCIMLWAADALWKSNENSQKPQFSAFYWLP